MKAAFVVLLWLLAMRYLAFPGVFPAIGVVASSAVIDVVMISRLVMLSVWEGSAPRHHSSTQLGASDLIRES